MELVIYTFGHIDASFYTLSGIAMIMSSNFADLMISTLSFISAAYFTIRAAYASSAGNAKFFLIKIFGMIIIINILLIPKTTITIKDHVTKKVEHVDNIPYGFALPVGIIENFGNILTMAFEQSFSKVDNFDYRNYGMIFGASMIRESRDWKIKNPEFIFNIHNFIKRCIIIDVGMGKYGINDLFENENIWSFLKEHSSNYRNIPIRIKNTHNLVSCRVAIREIFTEYFTKETNGIYSRYVNNILSLAGNISDFFTPRSDNIQKNFFKQNIEKVFGEYFGTKTKAEDQLIQAMMINSFSDYARNYGFTRSSIIQESNWKISGDLANHYLPILLSVMKNLIYASFIFIVPLMILGSGFTKYISYLTIVISIQLWPSLYTILNLFIDLYSASEIKDIAEGGITFASQNNIGNYADKIALVAAGMQIIVPFLAFSIVQGGVSGFIHLANSITSASNSAANIASSEVSTGNRSFDNYSSSNQQIANASGFKTDTNSSYKAGMQEWQNMDGSVGRTFADGSGIVQSGMGVNISGGGVKVSLRKAASDQVSKDISKTKSLLESSTQSYREAEFDTINKVSSLLAQIAERDYLGMNIDYSDLEEYSDSVGYYINETESIRESTGESWEKSANMALRASVGGSLFGAGMGMEVSANMSKNYTDSISHEKQLSEDTINRQDYSNLIRVASSEQFSTSNNFELSYSDDIRKSYEKQKTFEELITIQGENLKRYNEAYSKINSSEGSYEFDAYDELQKKVTERLGISTKDAHALIENRDPRIDDIWNEMIDKYKEKFIPLDISAQQIKIEEKLNEFQNKHKDKITKDTGLI